MDDSNISNNKDLTPKAIYYATRKSLSFDEKFTISTYVLYMVLSISIKGIPLLVILLGVSYYKKLKTKNTYLESHYIWQIRTFWFSLVWAFIGFASIYILVGYLILFIDLAWFFCRNCVGLGYTSAGQPIANISTFELFRNILVLLIWFVVVFSVIYFLFTTTT